MQYGSLNLLEPSGTVLAFPFTFKVHNDYKQGLLPDIEM
jgi:hypothetical protein